MWNLVGINITYFRITKIYDFIRQRRRKKKIVAAFVNREIYLTKICNYNSYYTPKYTVTIPLKFNLKFTTTVKETLTNTQQYSRFKPF